MVQKTIDGEMVAVQNFLGQTVLHAAAMRGFSSVIPVAIAAGIDKDRRDYTGSTALILAVRQGKPEFVSALLACNPDMTLLDDNEHSALWHAHKNNDSAMEKLLVEHSLKRDT